MKQIKVIFFTLFLTTFSILLAKENTKVDFLKEVVELKQEEVKPFIEVSEVSKESIDTLLVLKDIAKSTQKGNKLIEIHKALSTFNLTINEMLKQESYKNPQMLNARTLQQMQSELLIYLNKLNEWNSLLESNVEVYVKYRKMLKDESIIWDETNINAKKDTAPKAIREYIDSVIIKIEELEKNTKEGYDTTLTDLNLITTNILKIKDMIESLKTSESVVSNQIFHQNQLPFFKLLLEDEFSIFNYISSSYNSLIDKVEESKNYFQTHDKLVYIFYISSLLLISFVFYFNYLYKKKILFTKEESYLSKDFFFIKNPLSTFIILIVLSVLIIFLDSPKSLVDFLILLLILPVYKIVNIFIDSKPMKYLYIFLTLYILFLINKNSIGFELDSRVFDFIISGGLFYFIVSLFRDKFFDFVSSTFIKSLAKKIIYLFILLILISVISNIYGAVLLSSRIISGIFITIASALIFYAMYIILTGYILILLRRRISTASNIVEVYSQKLELTLVKIIRVIMFLWWIGVILKVVSLYKYLLEFRDEVLSLSWTISSTVISIESIVNFLFIVTGTWALSSVVTIVLKVEVFSRFKFPRGFPTVITTVLNYIIIITGTIIALSSLGVTPQQFTLVFGSLGVGIGFGLRNIIANFVSGLIMVFERPVQIGDTIEINQTIGSVQSIGARSSTIKTFDGSEVIIPNADFIAKEITNWTLSDQHRRKTVIFKVDYESNVELVIEIMKKVVLNHKDVLKDPEPLATFQGFGDNYLEFKLYFWLTDNLIVAQSEVSLEIYKELKKVGIKMPVPKQETLIKNFSNEKS